MSNTQFSKITLGLVFGLLCLGISFSGQAQGGAGNGSLAVGGTRLPFNPFNDSLATEALPLGFELGPGGSAVANDPVNGAPLFYADGDGIYAADGTELRALGGDPAANQPVSVVPVPGDDLTDGSREYYVFANEGGSIVRYTVSVNVQNAPVATVTAGPTPTGITGAANAMTIVPNADNSNFWLVTQEAGTGNMAVYDVANATVVGTGNTVIPQVATANNISYSEAAGQLAVADEQGVRFIDIDPATGTLTYANDFSVSSGVYDTEWSPDGSKLYASTGADGNVYQYNTTTGTITPISSQVPGVASVANYGLQRGPDGSVYHIYETPGGELQLGRINSADSAASLLSVESALLGGADLGGQQFSATASSNIDLSNVILQPTTVGGCTNNPVQLVPNILLNGGLGQPDNGIPDPDSIVWFIDGQRYVGFSPTLVPEQAPSVQATAYWSDDSVSVGPFPLPLQDFQLQVPVVQDTTICPDEVLELCAAPQDGGGQQGGGQGGGGVNIPIGGGQGGQQSCEAGSYTYLWSTGATTPNIEVDEAGVYWVLVTDPSTGCTAYAESNVKEYQVENQTYNEWYFGTGGGIDFNTLYDDPDDPDDGQITPIGDGDQSAPEGVEAVSDPNGDILFYTDGQTVWFVSRDPDTGENVHTVMPIADNPGGSGIGGSPDATQVVSIPVPGADALYYIFTTTAVENGGYELNYSIVDLRGSQASPGPAVVSSNNLLFVKSTERIAIQGGNGGPATLVAHEYGTDNFRAYPITAEGIGNPVISSAGSVHDIDNPDDGRGQIKFGGDSTGALVAVALDDRVEVYNFDTETLEISDPVTIDFSGQGQPYGVEFATDSSGNTVMYVSTDNGIYGATINSPIEEGQTIPTVLVSGTGGQNYGAIQRGPDGQIYVAQPGQNNIGSLSPNPNDPANSGYNAQALPDGLPNGAVSGLGLPTYVSQGGNSFPEPSISVTNACVGNEISFSATGRDESIEEYTWSIRQVDENGNAVRNVAVDSAEAQTFTMMIDSAGSYIAQVVLSNKCDEDSTLTQPFTVTDGVETILEESVQLCQGNVPLTAVDGSTDGLTFSWVLRGAVGGGNLPAENTITADQEGYYVVSVTNAEGCTSEDSTLVVDARPRINLPNDTTLCQGDELRLDVRGPGVREDPPGYEWIILDGTGATLTTSSEPVLQVDEITPESGEYVYTVTVTDEFDCFKQDTVAITIQPAPEVELTQTTPISACATDDGAIGLTFPNGDDPTQYSYQWSGPDGYTSAQQNPTGVGAGVYSVTITGPNSCPITESIGIDDPAAFTVDDVVTQVECNDASTITVTLGGLTPALYPVTIRVVGNEGTDTTIPSLPPGTTSFEILDLAPDTYSVELTSADGCTITEDGILIDEPEEVDFEFAQDVAMGCSEATIQVNYDISDQWFFEWFGPDGNKITEGNDLASFTTSTSGTYEVRVTDVDGVNPAGTTVCPATRDIPVFVDQSFLISLEEVEPDNSCETGEKQLTVNFNPEEVADRDLLYRWERDGVQLPLATRTITVTEIGDYRVTVIDRNSACRAPSEPLGVFVSQPLTASLFYDNACADGSAVPLYAGVSSVGSDSLSFRWFGPNGEALPAASERGDTLLIQPDYPEGQYRVEVTSYIDEIESCQTTARGDFVRDPAPTSNLDEGPFIICPRDPVDSIRTVTLRVDDNPLSTISWTTPLGDGANTADIVADRGGIYTVEITNEFGCTIVDSVEVIEDCRPRITAPNAFRPGGVNNEFFVYHKYVSTDDFDVRIFNRWGEMVYQSNERDFRWDGSYNGRNAPLGTYPYIIRYKADTEETGDNLRETRGGVMIIR